MKHLKTLPRHASRGFSLAEVTIAVGIAGLGLTSLLGFMPQSLDTLRQAGQVTTESRISQEIFSTLAMADWNNAAGGEQIGTTYNGRRYYDDLAMEVDPSDEGAMVSYVAEVEVPPLDLALPGTQSVSALVPDEYLRRVTVKVASTTLRNFDFDSARGGSFRTYASIVSRSGK